MGEIMVELEPENVSFVAGLPRDVIVAIKDYIRYGMPNAEIGETSTGIEVVVGDEK